MSASEEAKTVRLVVELPPDVKKEFKGKAAIAGKTMQGIAGELIRQWMKEQN